MRRRPRTALAAAAIAVAVAGCTADAVPPVAVPDAARATSPDIRQARWKISTHPSGNAGTLGKHRARRVRREGRAVRRLVREVYEALFLAPARRDEVVRARFQPRAARALPARAGVPAGATRVRTLVRRADIGIDAVGVRRAAASVTVRARGRAGDGRFTILHRATLWLERSEGRWKVIAFDIRQRPVR